MMIKLQMNAKRFIRDTSRPIIVTSFWNTLSITTHSPYMLGAFLEDNIELGLFYCLKRDEGVIIHTATEEELQTIYSDGIDAFFNLENLSELN